MNSESVSDKPNKLLGMDPRLSVKVYPRLDKKF